MVVTPSLLRIGEVTVQLQSFLHNPEHSHPSQHILALVNTYVALAMTRDRGRPNYDSLKERLLLPKMPYVRSTLMSKL